MDVVDVVDIDGSASTELGQALRPPAPSSAPPPPTSPGPRGRPILKTSSDGSAPDSELGDDITRRLEKMDGKLDWLISHVEATSITVTRRDSSAVHSSGLNYRAFGSVVSVIDADKKATSPTALPTLRSMADGSKRTNRMPMPPSPSASASLSPYHVKAPEAADSCPGVMHVSQQSVDTGWSRRHSGMRNSQRASFRNSQRASVAIPNLSRCLSEESLSRLGPLRGRGRPPSRGSAEQKVPAMFKNSLLARRIYEKSDGKDIEAVQKRIQALPKGLRASRNPSLDYIYTVLDDPSSSKVAWWTAKFLQALVLFTLLVTFLQIVEDPHLHGWSAAIAETVFDVVFLAEVCIRFCCAPSKKSFVFTAHTWIDIIAASAIAVRAGIGFVLPESRDDAVSVILLGVVPIMRLLKILRHFESFNVLIQAVYLTMEALPMLLYAVALITMTFATLIYIVETELFESPFRAVWFCLVTVSTVGYGDYSPQTTQGTIIVMMLIVLGVMLMAVPIGIIGNTFNQVWSARDYSLLLSKTRMKLHKWGYTARDIPTLFELVDMNGNGVLELDEFCELVKEMNIGLPEERIIALFEHMDKDGSGALDAAEFALEIFPESFLQAFVGPVHPSLQVTSRPSVSPMSPSNRPSMSPTTRASMAPPSPSISRLPTQDLSTVQSPATRASMVPPSPSISRLPTQDQFSTIQSPRSPSTPNRLTSRQQSFAH